VECLSRDRTKHQVAEVTSLGLVQMTRKKLGLGLLETFSEPCEQCAGRGIIVHHDPVVKHRAQQPERGSERRRGRGGNGGGSGSSGNGTSGNGNGNGNGAHVHEGTHQLTEEARNSLARIAASTLGHPATGSVPVVTADASAAETPAAEDEAPRGAGRRSRSRRARGGGATDAAAEQAPVTEAPIIELPAVHPAPEPRRVDPEAAAKLLESVLDAALPAKQPRRSRRVSTGALTTEPQGESAAVDGTDA
jgi:ribonuclease E